MTAKREPQICKCGCNEWTKGGTFRPGHDAKFHARMATRRAMATRILDYFDAKSTGHDWLMKGAGRFCWADTIVTNLDAATALLDYFFPADASTHDRRRANGYIVSAEPSVIWSTILRSYS